MKWMVSSSHSMWHNLPEPESECPAAHSLAAEGAVLTVTAGSRLAGRSATPTPVSDSWRITSSLTPVLLLDRRLGTAVWSEPQRAEASRNSRTHASGPAHSQNSCRPMLKMCLWWSTWTWGYPGLKRALEITVNNVGHSISVKHSSSHTVQSSSTKYSPTHHTNMVTFLQDLRHVMFVYIYKYDWDHLLFAYCK